MPVPDQLLPRRRPIDGIEGQRYFDQFPALHPGTSDGFTARAVVSRGWRIGIRPPLAPSTLVDYRFVQPEPESPSSASKPASRYAKDVLRRKHLENRASLCLPACEVSAPTGRGHVERPSSHRQRHLAKQGDGRIFGRHSNPPVTGPVGHDRTISVPCRQTPWSLVVCRPRAICVGLAADKKP